MTQFEAIGLPNIGNTCYMNSSLQCLLGLDIFNYDIGTVCSLYNLLKILFVCMNTNKQDSIIQCLKQIQSKMPKFNNRKQHCSNEFLHDLLDCLHEETKINQNDLHLIADALPSDKYIENMRSIAMNEKLLLKYHQHHIKNFILFEYYKFCKTIKQSIVTNNISNILCQLVQCKNCNYISPTFQLINIFDVTIVDDHGDIGALNLIDLICQNDISNSVIEQYFCDKCNTHSDSLINKKLFKSSKYIIFSFNRFNNNLRKNKAIVNCPSNIDIGNLFWNFANCDNKSYEMINNISHYGSLNSGHYVANCKRGNKWFLFDDNNVQPVLENNESDNVYLVFYKQSMNCTN